MNPGNLPSLRDYAGKSLILFARLGGAEANVAWRFTAKLAKGRVEAKLRAAATVPGAPWLRIAEAGIAETATLNCIALSR